jgi:uncharacterized protein YbjT (DUF2867 family)
MDPLKSTPGPILVTGGTGTLGSHVVRALRGRGCQVRVLSRHARTGIGGVQYLVGDLAQGTGLEEAVADVDAIVHCASGKRGDADATRNLIEAACALKPASHFVFISIVGVDGIRFGYFETKLAVEKLVVESGLPWTVQRSTQFYDFILKGAERSTRFPVVFAPKDFRCQPIDPVDVAGALVVLALGPASGRAPDIGGPEVTTWADMIRTYMRVVGKHRPVVQVRMPGTKAIRAGGLLVQEPGGKRGVRTWRQFLAEKLGEPQSDSPSAPPHMAGPRGDG